MFHPNDLLFLEKQIVDAKARVMKIFNADPEEYSYQADEYNETLAYHLKQLYRLACAYFEAKQLPTYLTKFEAALSKRVNDPSKIVQIKDHDGDPYLVTYVELVPFLQPFKALAVDERRVSNLEIVQSILDETPHILNHSGCKPKNEAAICREVEWVLKFYFDTRKTNTARFLSKFKTYRPDILIPEVDTAIEFKLARGKVSIDEYIDELSVDAIAYKGDPHYRNFFAVLCVTGLSATKKDVETAWREKKFPSNWFLSVVNL